MTKRNQLRTSEAPRRSGSLVESKNVAELIRVACIGQDGSIREQEDICREIVERHGLVVKWKITILGVPGNEVEHTPEMSQLQEIVKSGECGGIVARDVARLVRPSAFPAYEIFKLLADHNVKLYTETDVFAFAQPHDRLAMSVYSGLEKFAVAMGWKQ
jgi:DNA invertase Pin-like site-specific DNA recombinase